MKGPGWDYPLIMLLALLVGLLISRRTQQSLELGPGQRIGIALGAILGGTIGARLPFVLSDWDGLLSGEAWFAGGKTIVFALIGGYFGVELTKWALEIRIKTGDSFAVPVAVSIGIGRLGCFSAGCCHGSETSLSWGVDFGDGLSRHPTQLYESVFHLGAGLLLWLLLRREMFRGQLIKLYIIVYLVYRFLSEWMRPEPRVWSGLTVYQITALVFVPVFVGLWMRDRRVIVAAASADRP